MKALIFAGCIAATVSCNNSSSKSDTTTKDSSSSEKKSDTTSNTQSDWVSLFDGKTTNGWHAYGKSAVGSAWKVDSGALHLTVPKVKSGYQNRDGGDIVTADEYENFDLKLEWRISPKGNSGIIFLVHE